MIQNNNTQLSLKNFPEEVSNEDINFVDFCLDFGYHPSELCDDRITTEPFNASECFDIICQLNYRKVANGC